MAYSKEQWERAKIYFEAGTHSLSEISKEVGIEKSSIAKKAKIQQWKSAENSDYIESKLLIASKKSTLNSTTLQILDDIAETKIRRSGLVFGGLENAIKRANDLIESNQTVEKINVGDGIQNFEPRELNATDIKNVVSTLIDAGKSFGLIENQPNVRIDNQNNQQTNIEVPQFNLQVSPKK